MRKPSRLPAHLSVTGDAEGPLDELSRARLRRLLASFLGEFATLDAHLDLLDARGAWYAEKALGAWSPEHPDSFFGLVRHVVRTQLDGPPPAPDIEGWLAAGRPDSDALGQVWDSMRALRYSPGTRPATTARSASSPSVNRVDAIVIDWPQDQIEAFVRAYGALENVLERRQMVLPPVDA